ncbi:thermonuclease family protein [Sneathiella glossodoripedis]|uniref:thermonuclease family protein n=1 Tax=Sneathiella glossodoripedis TaxID=418853 RepID=UPI0011DDEA6C|nr:hypothetical protein [Sneathiella glossodoripedis]
MFSCLERSTEMTTEYLPETPVRCDVLFELGSDKVGIANCFDGDINIGAELIKRGIAYAERRFAGGIYLPEEYLARVKEVGLWSNYHMHPEDHRVQRQEAEMRYRATRHLGSNGPKIIEHFRKKYETDGGLIKPQDE